MITAPEIGQEVVRSKGDYVVGRVGNVIALDMVKGRAQVDWESGKTWVSFNALEPTSIPYFILEGYEIKKGFVYPKYQRLMLPETTPELDGLRKLKNDQQVAYLTRHSQSK